MAQPTRLDAVELSAAAHELAQPVNGSDAPLSRSWIQVARVGAFNGHPMGPFEFTPAVFDQIVANFNRTANHRVPLDFEHATEMPAYAGDIATQGAPATGWIVQLENRGSAGLWGLVEWLEPGLSYVRQGRYRYFSPAVIFEATDRVTGEDIGPTLVSGALTNRPFLDGMQPVTARAVSTRKEEDNMKIEELLKALALAMGEDGAVTADQAVERVSALSARSKDLEAQVTTLSAEKVARDRAEAEGDVDALIKDGLVANTPDARTQALEVRMSSPKAFAAIFSHRKAASKKVADAPVQPTDRDAAALMSRQAPTGGAPTAPVTDTAGQDNHSLKALALAEKLQKDEPEVYGRDFAKALKEASRRVWNADRAMARG